MPFDWMDQNRPHAIARGLYQFDELCRRNFDVFGAFKVPQSILEPLLGYERHCVHFSTIGWK